MAQVTPPARRTTPDEANELSALRAELEHQRTENAIKEQQLDRYAADLRATSRRERQRARELSESYMATVRALAGAVEARDAYTAHHADRVTAYGIELAVASGLEIAGDSELECAFLLHDIGKVAIPDGILFKAGTLDAEERTIMERHPVIGESIISEIAFLEPARPLVRHHHERRKARAAILADGFLQGVQIDPMASVHWNQAERIAADARDVHGFPDAAMGRHRGVRCEPLRTPGDTRAPHLETQLGIAGNQDADEVGHRGSRDKQAGRAFRKAEDPLHPPDNLALHVDRDVIAPSQVGVQAGCEHLRQHAYGCAASMHPAHEARVHIASGEGQDIAHEFPMHGRKIGRRLGKFATEAGPHFVGNRLPDGTFADVFDVIENVVEHPVRDRKS